MIFNNNVKDPIKYRLFNAGHSKDKYQSTVLNENNLTSSMGTFKNKSFSKPHKNNANYNVNSQKSSDKAVISHNSNVLSSLTNVPIKIMKKHQSEHTFSSKNTVSNTNDPSQVQPSKQHNGKFSSLNIGNGNSHGAYVSS